MIATTTTTARSSARLGFTALLYPLVYAVLTRHLFAALRPERHLHGTVERDSSATAIGTMPVAFPSMDFDILGLPVAVSRDGVQPHGSLAGLAPRSRARRLVRRRLTRAVRHGSSIPGRGVV